MEKALPKGTTCFNCGHEFQKGDTNVHYWKEENIYRCEPCAQQHFKTEVYARIVGYYSPTNLWNKGKKEEWKDRKEFVIDKSDKSGKIKTNEQEAKNQKT